MTSGLSFLYRFAFLSVAVTLMGGCQAPDMRTAKRAVSQGDYETARYHYEKLAAFGIPEARLELGMMEVREQGLSADPLRGVALLEESAGDDTPRALFELGKTYQEGKTVPQDIAKAEALYRQSFQTGYYRAAVRMGGLYKNGKGRPVDLMQALAWYYTAQRHGVTGIEEHVRTLETQLGPEASSQARILSEGVL